MNDFLGISIVGAIVSLIIQYTKRWYEANSLEAKAISIGVSILVGTFYVVLRNTGWLETVVGILAAASTVFAFILKGENPA